MELLRSTVQLLIGALELVFVVRAVCSWFNQDDGDLISTVYEFTYNLTEPLVMPMRMLMSRASFARGLPIDLPFFFTFVIISLLGTMI